MNYTFRCECGHRANVQASMVIGPPADMVCGKCGDKMGRDWQADAPMLDTSGCRDHSDIPMRHRTASAYDRRSPESMERQFHRQIQNRRKEIKDAGGQRGSIKQTHSVPTHLYHGKIKETGDKNYWSDPKNLNKHKECKVDG